VAAEFASQDTSLSDIIKGIILIAPTLRNSSSQVVSRMLLRTLLRGNWGINVWQRYHKSLYVTNKPTELDEYVRDLTANLGQGNRLSVVRQFLRSEKSGCGSRLSEVSAPVLLIFGEKDPSLRSPKHEAKWLKRQFTRALSITTELIEGSGHYPHVEFPDKIYSISKSFIANLDSSWKKSGKSHI
jgi:pimeloyl-ACP methyl ester carboxylesterase